MSGIGFEIFDSTLLRTWQNRDKILANMMRESESLSMIVRSRLNYLPTLGLMALNDVVLGDKETFAEAFAVVAVRTEDDTYVWTMRLLSKLIHSHTLLLPTL